jgi:hypothetical protein
MQLMLLIFAAIGVTALAFLGGMLLARLLWPLVWWAVRQ